MPQDAVFLSAVIGEISPQITGGKVDKIHQPERDELIFSIRCPEAGNIRLLISASPNHPRMHLTSVSKENPAAPPMFCMLLRKHLAGTRITGLFQPHLERSVSISFIAADEMGEYVKKQLVVELMGRRSNVILCGPDGRIIDCMRRVEGDSSRPVLPGLFYRPPQMQDKTDPCVVTTSEISGLLEGAKVELALDQWMLQTFLSMPPLVCRELVYRAFGRTDTRVLTLSDLQKREFCNALYDFFQTIKSGPFRPVLLYRGDVPFDFSYMPINQYENQVLSEEQLSFSGLLEAFYAKRDLNEHMRQKSQSLVRSVTNHRDRTKRKLAIQREELAAAGQRDRIRELGDIVTANLHQMERGMTTLRAQDFYDPEMREIDIPLNPLLSPQQNAAKYYKEYTKAKNAEQFLTRQIASGETELEYLNSVLEELSKAESERDLQEIRLELMDSGYLPKQKSKQKEKPSAPLRFTSSSGMAIYVGKNNRQNDQLTTKTAHKSDLWLHVQKIHGSHVIISGGGQTPDDNTITEAALLAAYYSQARESSNVPVDYTLVKNVKKPVGAKPGMVIYENYKTAYVTPSKAAVDALLSKGESQ